MRTPVYAVAHHSFLHVLGDDLSVLPCLGGPARLTRREWTRLAQGLSKMPQQDRHRNANPNRHKR